MQLSKKNMKPDQPVYTVERLNAVNILDLTKLYEAVYNRPASHIFFKNKYNTAYTGVEHVGFIAYNSTRLPIAFYGVIPCFLQYQTNLILAAQSADTMTHPGYRGLGLFTKLAKQTFELCKEKHIRLLFGFPNQNSLPGFVKKLGWEVTGMMDCFTIPVGKIAWDVHAKKCFRQSGFIITMYYRHLKGIWSINMELLIPPFKMGLMACTRMKIICSTSVIAKAW